MALLLAWQETADEEHLQALVSVTRRLMERVALGILRRSGIADVSAVDDAVSLVLDHLRRLSCAPDRERRVASFRPSATAGDSDAGEAYLVWLTTERTRDVIRRRQRREQMAKPFSSLAYTSHQGMPWEAAAAESGRAPPAEDRASRLEQVLIHLEPPLTTVIRMLLAGHSQKAIAEAMGVCEGTVSRQRARAIERLRGLLS
jgi:RNA polymerase sigma factor (sigma-70 family)